MKKLLISFLTGAVLIGIGSGVMAMEVSDWDYADTRTSLLNEPKSEKEEEFAVNFNAYDTIDIYVPFSSDEFRSQNITTVEKDEAYTNTVLIKVVYKGEEPRYDLYNFDFGDSDSNNYRINVYSEGIDSFKELKSFAKEMFETKTFYRNYTDYSIMSIVIKTAYPEKITVKQW